MTIVCLLLAGSQMQAQECVDKLLQTVEVLAAQCDPANHNSYHTTYSLEQKRWDGQRQNQRFDLYSDGNRHYLFSDEYMVLADETLTVSVQEPSGLISIGSSLRAEMREQSIARVMQQQVTNIKMLELQSCEIISVGGEQRTQLVLRCPDRYRAGFNIDRKEYQFDDATLYEVTVFSLEGGPAKETTYRIHTVETDGDFAQLGKEPTDFILDSNGKLLREYAKFTVEQIGNAAVTTNIPSTLQNQ